MNTLPLSWSYGNEDMKNNRTVNRWNIKWPAICSSSSANFVEEIISNDNPKRKTLVRGCGTDIKNSLVQKGFRSILVGSEAVLHTDEDHFSKKSLKKLIKRGIRNGKIITIPFNETNSRKLKVFRNQAVHGNSPQLENLFKLEFTKENILNVFLDHKDQWIGAIMISINSAEKLHTELLLRKMDTPYGVMESLIEYSFNYAQEHGFSEFSLGEVPFIFPETSLPSLKSTLLQKMGKILNFAYNYQGLYNFKNKFNPDWQDVYVCSNSRIGFKQLYFLYINTNFNNLVVHKILYILKDYWLLNKLDYSGFFIPRKLDFNKT